MRKLDVIYLDNHLLVVRKPASMLVQKDRTGDESLLDLAKAFIKNKFAKPGNVYLGLVHRLDRPVSGTIVFARTSKAASRLCEQFRDGKVEKRYKALVEGKVEADGKLENRIDRRGTSSVIVSGNEGKLAKLSFSCLQSSEKRSIVEISLETGRHHQIRLQFAHSGHPVVGDFRYGSTIKYKEGTIALHACSLSFNHPTLNKKVTFESKPDIEWESLL